MNDETTEQNDYTKRRNEKNRSTATTTYLQASVDVARVAQVAKALSACQRLSVDHVPAHRSLPAPQPTRNEQKRKTKKQKMQEDRPTRLQQN